MIIGLGTGRCGTQSLSGFLSSQPGMTVLHEGTIKGRDNPFRWEGDHERVRRWIDGLPDLLNRPAYCGDIGMYYLPYCEFLIAHRPDIRFVCLERDRSAVVESFLRRTQGRHPWMRHDGRQWRIDPVWDAAYPKFDEPDKAKAAGLYWDLYRAEVNRLIGLHPDRVRRFSTESLNSKEGMSGILDFIGYHGARRLEQPYCLNSSRGVARSFLRTEFERMMYLARPILPASVRQFLWDNLARHLYYRLR